MSTINIYGPEPKKSVFWMVIIGFALLLIYLYFSNQAPTVTTNTARMPIDNSSNAPAVTVAVNTGTGQSINAFLAANGTVSVPSAVIAWAQTLPANNQAQFFKMLPNMTAADINGLMDLLINDWGKTGVPTQAQIDFWNTWRTTYHINDGTIQN